MKNFFDEADRLYLHEKKVFIPTLEDALKELIKRIAPIYKEFIERGKFYDQEIIYEFGRQYVKIFETDGYGEPYKTIGDWAEELTGNEIFLHGYIGETYGDLIEEEVRNYVEEILGDYATEIESYGLVETELEEEILKLPIEMLEDAIKVNDKSVRS